MNKKGNGTARKNQRKSTVGTSNNPNIPQMQLQMSDHTMPSNTYIPIMPPTLANMPAPTPLMATSSISSYPGVMTSSVVPVSTGSSGNPMPDIPGPTQGGEGNIGTVSFMHNTYQHCNSGQRADNSLNSTPIALCNLSTADYAQNTPQATRSVHDDISLNVSQPIRDKIVKGQYIDLGILLSNTASNSGQKQNLIYDQGQLTLEPVKANKISNIETWTDAMIIYISVYCSVHVTKFQELLKYMNSIRLGAKRCQGNGWYLYDQQYRLKKAQDPASSWGSMDPELWLMYMQPQTAQYSRVQNYKCYAFNYEGFCNKNGCFYQHSCIRCNNAHPVKHCQYETQSSPFRNPLLNSQPTFRYPSNSGSFRGTPRSSFNRFNFRSQFRFRGQSNRHMGPR